MVVTVRGYTDWSWYGNCKVCSAQSGERCVDLRRSTTGRVRYKDVPHPGRVKRTDH